MKDIEFISYLPTPQDQYMLGIATIRILGKLIVRFKHMHTKDQTGTFFAPANYAIPEGAGKRYLSCFELDSKMESQMLSDFIRENVNNVLNQQKNHQPQRQPIAQSASIFEPTVPNLPF